MSDIHKAENSNGNMKDIASFRNPNELPHHWQLRKEFIEMYYDRFDVDRLECLSQLFINIECMGLSYPNEVMSQIKELGSKVKGLEHYKYQLEKEEPELPRKQPSYHRREGGYYRRSN